MHWTGGTEAIGNSLVPGEAQIIVTDRRLPNGARDRRYSWQGDIDLPVRVCRIEAERFLGIRTGIRGDPMPVTLIIGPYLIHRIGEFAEFVDDGALYVRDDSLWRLIAARFIIREAWRRFTVRAVLTLHIWGLADVKPGWEPSWRDVRVPRREGIV